MRAPFTVFTLLILALIPAQVHGQNQPPVSLQQTTPTAPAPMSESTERQVRKAVVFITMHCLRGAQPVTAQGTGFIVAVLDSRVQGAFHYIVTNRHVAMCWDENRNPLPVQSVGIRMNLRDGSSTEATAPENLPWILPSDESVDLALFTSGPDPKTVDFLSIPESNFVTDEVFKKESISEGMKIIFSGFFYQVPGLRHVEPILREGVIAMIPDEDLITTTGKLGKVYLGEVHAFHGNSGSPVFVDVRRGLGWDYHLLGVVSGGYGEGEQNALLLETPMASKPGNSGIAMIVPATEVEKL